MADPLTITSGVLRIVLSCIKGIQIAKEYVDKYNNAELKLIALSVNCEAVHEALTQIRDLFLSDNIQPMLRNRDASSQESFETLERVIGNCSVVFAVLHQRLEPLLLPTFNKENAVSKKSKIAAVWNDSSIDFLVDLSKGLTPAVQLLFTAFQAKSTFEAHKILTSHDAATLFHRVDSDTQSLYTSHREQSILAPDGAPSILGDEEFPDLDERLVGTGPYRRVLQASLKRLSDADRELLIRDVEQSSDDATAHVNSAASPLAQERRRSASPQSQPALDARKPAHSFLSTLFKPRHSRPTSPRAENGAQSRSPRTGAASEQPISSSSTAAGTAPPSEGAEQQSGAADPWEEVRSLVESVHKPERQRSRREPLNISLDVEASKTAEWLKRNGGETAE